MSSQFQEILSTCGFVYEFCFVNDIIRKAIPERGLSVFKNTSFGTGNMTQCLRVNECCSSRGSGFDPITDLVVHNNLLFHSQGIQCPLWHLPAQYTHGTQTNMQAYHPYT